MATIICARCGRSSEPLAAPPMGGTLGDTILKRVCPDCWVQWGEQSRLLINHYQLLMADPDDRKRLNQAMKEYLGLDQAP
jgi:Fe-S cluster biosynthesis and repair protein YggX